jgi:hypothetical protein
MIYQAKNRILVITLPPFQTAHLEQKIIRRSIAV